MAKAACQKALAKEGIDVAQVNKIFAALKIQTPSDPGTQGHKVFYADTSNDPKIKQFLTTEKGKTAGGFQYGDDIALRHAFFNARGGSRITPEISRALVLIHEVIHLSGRVMTFLVARLSLTTW